MIKPVSYLFADGPASQAELRLLTGDTMGCVVLNKYYAGARDDAYAVRLHLISREAFWSASQAGTTQLVP